MNPKRYLLNVLILSFICHVFIITVESKGYAKSKDTVYNEHVILLHGMGRTKRSMGKLERYLKKNGYQTYNSGYPSTRKSIE